MNEAPAAPPSQTCNCQECRDVALPIDIARRWADQFSEKGWRFHEGRGADGNYFFEGRRNGERGLFIARHKRCRQAALRQALRHCFSLTNL